MEEFPLSLEDAGEVLTLQRAAYVSEAQIYRDPFLPPLTQTLEELKRELSDGARGIGLRHEGRLVGAVRWVVEDGVARLARLVVAPDLQGLGIGTRLLRSAEAMSGVHSFELFTGHRSMGNIRLYEREGYVEVRREVVNEDLELVYLRKG